MKWSWSGEVFVSNRQESYCCKFGDVWNNKFIYLLAIKSSVQVFQSWFGMAKESGRVTSDSSHILNAVVCICHHQRHTFEGHLIIICKNAKGTHFFVWVCVQELYFQFSGCLIVSYLYVDFPKVLRRISYRGPLATSSLEAGRFAAKQGSLRSPRGRLAASLTGRL